MDHITPGESMPDVEVINISKGGVALKTLLPVNPGEHLVFSTQFDEAPVHCEVLACDELPEGGFRLRCKCILGGFSVE